MNLNQAEKLATVHVELVGLSLGRVVVHVEFFETKDEAISKEKYYKSGRGSQKKNQIIHEYLARWAHTLP